MEKKSAKKQSKKEVQVSQNEKMRAAAKTRKKEKKKHELLLAGGIILVVLALAVIFGSFSLFYIEGVQVEGNDGIYTDEQIIAAAGLSDVSNMLSFRSESAENAIEWALPFVEQAKVHRVLPGVISVEVTYAVETFCVQAGTVWLHLSQSGKVLASEQQRDKSLTLLTGITVTGYTVGEYAVFEDEAQFEAAQTILQEAAKAGLGFVNSVDVSSVASVRFAIDYRFYVRGASVSLVAKKMPLLATVIEEKKEGTARYSLAFASDGSITVGNYDGDEPYELPGDASGELVPVDPQIPTVVIDPNADSVG